MSLGYLTASVLIFVLTAIMNERYAEKRRKKTMARVNNWLTEAVDSAKGRAEKAEADGIRALSVNAKNRKKVEDERA